MQIEIQIDESCTEPKIVVITDRMTEEVSEIVKKLSEERTKAIAGFRDGMSRKSSKSWGYEVTEMEKKLILRGLFGFPVGIAIGHVITILISAFVGDGAFYPVTRELTEAMGSELRAVVCQTVLCGVMGTGFAMASLIWEMDSWSLARQSGCYFAAACVLMLPIAYVTNWMKHTVAGVLAYVGIFAAVFLVVWLLQYCAWKSRIQKMNARIRRDGSQK